MCRSSGPVSISQLTEDDRALVLNRSGLTSFGDNDTICYHHQKMLLDKFEFLQKTCCDIFGIHKAPVKSSLRTVTLDQSLYLQESMGLQVKAGWKMCPKCRMKSKEVCSESEEDDTEFVSPEEKEDILNQSISEMPDVSPVKLSRIGSCDRLAYAKRKFKQIADKSQELVAECTEVPMDVLPGSSQQTQESVVKSEADIEYLVGALKQKMILASKQQQISLLTLAPKSWTISRMHIPVRMRGSKVTDP